MRLAQEVAALHLALAGSLDDLHDLPPVLVPAIPLGMVLQPAMDELGGPLCKPVFLNQPSGCLLWGLSQRRPRKIYSPRRNRAIARPLTQPRR
jgi:hypothetical protein